MHRGRGGMTAEVEQKGRPNGVIERIEVHDPILLVNACSSCIRGICPPQSGQLSCSRSCERAT